jgi:hypothetical protein
MTPAAFSVDRFAQEVAPTQVRNAPSDHFGGVAMMTTSAPQIEGQLFAKILLTRVTAMGISSRAGNFFVGAYVLRPTLKVALQVVRRDRPVGHRVRILSAVLMITDRQTGNA